MALHLISYQICMHMLDKYVFVHAVTFTSSSSNEDYTLYHNLWWHNSRFYGLTDASSNDTIKIDMSYNLELTALPVRDAQGYCNNIKVLPYPLRLGNTSGCWQTLNYCRVH